MNARQARRWAAIAVRAASEVVRLDELGTAALPALCRAAGAHGSLLYRFDGQGALQHVAGDLVDRMARYSPELFEQDPAQHAMLALGRGRRVLPDAMLDRAAFERSEAYQAFYGPNDMGRLLGLWLTDGPYAGPGMTGILLTRSADTDGFAQEALRVLPGVVDALRMATTRAERVAGMEREREALATVLALANDAPQLLLDADGRLLWASPEASELLGPLLRGSRAPEQLCKAASALTRATDDAPRLRLSLAHDGGPAVEAELYLVAGSAAPLVAASLTVAEQTDARLRELGERHALTPAEVRVLGCLAQGLTNRQIAERLYVSVETIKTHVRRILGKLDVRSRTQAVVKVGRLD